MLPTMIIRRGLLTECCVSMPALGASMRWASGNASAIDPAITPERHSLPSSSTTSIQRPSEAIASLAEEIFSLGNKHLKTVEEITSLPDGLHSFPEVCFIGKPNCGKSTIIGALCHNYHMGRSGKRPGQTTKLEFFNVGDALLLVDTPGYGSWKRTLAEQAIGVTNLKRYLALRTKQGSLKQAYWVMECSDMSRPGPRELLRFQARDEELRDLLMFEKVPFTVLLNKTDRLRDSDPELIAQCANDVYEFLGTDRVPVLDIAARPAAVSAAELAGGRNRNIRKSNHTMMLEPPRNTDILSCDIVHHCCADLRVNEPLTLSSIRSLSYLPPTSEDVISVEGRYPFGGGVLPVRNSETMEAFIGKHEAAKLRLAEHVLNGPSRKIISEKALGDVLFLGSASPLGVRHTITASATEAADLSIAAPATHSRLLQDTSASQATTIVAAPTPHLTTSDPFALDGGASMLPSHKESAAYCSSVIGASIPRSMVVPSIDAAAKRLDRAGEAYAEMVERQGYDGVVKSNEEFFVARGAMTRQDWMAVPHGKKRMVMTSHLQRNTNRMLDKYIRRSRKDRSIQLDAHGYMCPWLAGSRGTRVIQGEATMEGSGPKVVRGLKQSGFGGMSLTSKTLKNRGRATKKTGSWAS